MAVAAIVVLVVELGAFTWWRKTSSSPPIASQARCSVYWQPSEYVQPTKAGDVTIDIAHPPMGENKQEVHAGDMTFRVANPNVDPGFREGPGSDLNLEVTDSRGRSVYHQSLQIWQGPTNEFGGNTGFTGLLYITDPETGAIVQFSCEAS